MKLRALNDLLNIDDDSIIAYRNGQALYFSYFQMQVRSFASAHRMQRAALICHDSYNFLVGLFGLLYSGAEVIMPPSQNPELLHSLQSEFDDVVTDQTIEALIPPKKSQNPVLDTSRAQMHFFTSGSSGAPKCIKKTMSQLQSEIEVLEQYFAAHLHSQFTHAVVYATVPHYHFYGFIFRLLWPLASRRAFDTKTYAVWEELWPFLIESATIISSPAHLSRIEGLHRVEHKPFIFSAGASLPASSLPAIKEIFGSLPYEIFGSTETGAIATRRQADDQIWHPFPSVSVTQDNDGQMITASPYANESHTGDIIKLTDNGFHFLQRSGGLVKVKGNRISLVRVKTALKNLSDVSEAFVIVVEKSDALGAAIILNEAGQARQKDLGNFRYSRTLRKELAAFLDNSELPRLWRFVSGIPHENPDKNPLGKIHASDIQSLFQEDVK